MNPDADATTSVWMDTADVPQFEKLTSNIVVDVCVVGAGITGLTTALLLLKEGRSVCVVDDGSVGGGETQRTTAHLSNEIDDRYFNIIGMHGKDAARKAWQSQTAAIDLIESNVRDLNIDCDFRRLDGYLFLCAGQKKALLEKELKACRDIGFTEPQLLNDLPFDWLDQPIPCIRFPRQAQFHVLKYLKALAEAIVGLGGSIFCHTHVSGVDHGQPVQVKTEGGASIKASHVVIATNSPITDWVKVQTKQTAWRTYAIAVRIEKGRFPSGLFWDTNDPYHYVRTQPADADGFDWVLIGGEDHRTGEAKNFDQRFSNLENWARQLIPHLGSVDFHWSGQVYEPIDGLPWIGKDPAYKDRVFIASGDSGMGMTNGSCAAILLTDLICGRTNDWQDLYNPARKPILAAGEYIADNVNTAWQYLDYFRSDADSIEEIAAGEGAIVDHKGQKLAIFRDDSGNLHQMSAACPHLRGIVQWNACEHSWDCPAHGSRFTATGEVIDGPANSNLPAAGESVRFEDEHGQQTYLPPTAESGGIQPPSV